ncbi:MAG: succinyl-diaminopimelate desuccinylase [Legionellales bacterium]|nr:succinyl-diaminopimelate desuccinylase [Legionellales bacterium]OUX65185.1 MAG: succinyl-diaminopimelate desuccinylase [Gammaproteobacteria bacterium TMED281]
MLSKFQEFFIKLPKFFLNDNLIIMNSIISPSSILKDLISFRSVTPCDGDCQKYIVDFLGNLEFKAKKIEKNGIINHWIINQKCDHRTLLYACHTDVVPADSNDWRTPPFEGTINKKVFYGRGACDMKGSIAAMLAALKELKYEGFKTNVAWIVTGDEEGDAEFGTKYVIKKQNAQIQKIRSALVGEPTSEEHLGDVLKNGRRGSLNLFIEVHGLAGHAAYQENAKNPINVLVKIINELSTLSWGKVHSYFPQTSFCVSQLQSGNQTFNQTPQTAIARLNWRFSPTISPSDIKSAVVNTVNRFCKDYKLLWKESALPFFTKPDKLHRIISESIFDVCGIRPKTKTNGGTSDARFLKGIIPEIIEFGLINKTAHQPNESVTCSELDQLKEIYKRILKNYSVK